MARTGGTTAVFFWNLSNPRRKNHALLNFQVGRGTTKRSSSEISPRVNKNIKIEQTIS